MVVSFSLLYTIFGPHPVYYHLFQFLIFIGSAIIFYLLLRLPFKKPLALFLALIFMLHPINSQVAFAIPSLQDALCVFFGLLSLYLAAISKTNKHIIALLCMSLFLTLLAKESGIVFVVATILYFLWFNTKKMLAFISGFILPFIAYLVLRINAVGLIAKKPINAPIDQYGLLQRFFTMPSISN
jgi:4-amino-4-deoxy-L-arabinose transferase-like glycosyltransferase